MAMLGQSPRGPRRIAAPGTAGTGIPIFAPAKMPQESLQLCCKRIARSGKGGLEGGRKASPKGTKANSRAWHRRDGHPCFGDAKMPRK